jgi:hypothetical protein
VSERAAREHQVDARPVRFRLNKAVSVSMDGALISTNGDAAETCMVGRIWRMPSPLQKHVLGFP